MGLTTVTKMKRIWRNLLLIFFVSIVGFAGFMVYLLQTEDLDYLYLCATKGAPIPQQVCEYYFFHFRGSKEDITDLENGIGLATVFHDKHDREFYDLNKQKPYMDFLLSKGININKTNRYDGGTPLHAAVVYNDVELAKYLLAHGANPTIKSAKIDRLPEYGDKTPLETAKLMQRGSNNQEDRSAMIHLLETQGKIQ